MFVYIIREKATNEILKVPAWLVGLYRNENYEIITVDFVH